MEIINILRKIIRESPIFSETKTENIDLKEDITLFRIMQLKKLFPFMIPHWKKALIASILLFLDTFFSLPQPLFIKYIFDDVILGNKISMLALVIAVLISIMLIEAIVKLFKEFYSFFFEQNIILEIQCKLFQRALRFPKSFFDSKQTGYLMSRFSSDISRLRMLFSGSIINILTSILKFGCGIAILFYLHWKLTLYSLLFFALLFYHGPLPC